MSRKNLKQLLKSQSFKRSNCPLSCTLDIIGDKWSLLIIRDLFLGKTKYSDFVTSEEGIPTNILASRLQLLEKTGLIKKVKYQDRPKRYEYQLTESGKGLGEVIKSIIKWGNRNIPGTRRVD